ncbi:hypothetical protein SLS62_002225 [Diatrype stigma]|uniref:gamma-glutamylcyclotransferase n=1 Tax=Diatrype stigma TaxID=117547 RepID=A0AAN9YSD2_9PEZI
MSSLSPPRPSLLAEEVGSRELYFAYGSNMHLQQMAARCPESTLFGIGILRGYKWQTNSRGGGNVVEGHQEDAVEGILFTLSPSDLEALRPFEGTSWGYFEEQKLGFEVEHLLDSTLEGRKTTEAATVLERYKSGQMEAPATTI